MSISTVCIACRRGICLSMRLVSDGLPAGRCVGYYISFSRSIQGCMLLSGGVAYRPGNHANTKYGEMWKHLHVNIFFIKKEGVDPYWLCIKKKQELFKKWKRRKQNAISCHIEVLYIYKSNNCLLLDLWRTMANSCTQM